MKNKIKGLAYGISTAVLAAPAVAFAAYTVPETGLPGASIMEIITAIMNWLLTAIGIAGVIGFAIAGILYLTAAGDEDKIKKAKSAMVASIIGVLVAVAGVVALNAATTLLKGGTF